MHWITKRVLTLLLSGLIIIGFSGLSNADIMHDVNPSQSACSSLIWFQVNPTPFYESTVLEYQVIESSQVTIDVYDWQGKKIQTLINHQLAPGFYRLNWAGQDTLHHPADAGFYYFRLSQNNELCMQRIGMLVR